MTEETGSSGATPESGPDPAAGATPGGRQEPTTGATPAAGSTEGATPDTPLGDSGEAALERERVARREAEKQAREYRRRITDLEDAGKPELERAQSMLQRTEAERDAHAARVAELEANLKARDMHDLRRQVATESGLPLEMADRLKGDDLRSLRADATKLVETLGSSRAGDVGIGRGGTAAGRSRGVDMNTLIREAAGRG